MEESQTNAKPSDDQIDHLDIYVQNHYLGKVPVLEPSRLVDALKAIMVIIGGTFGWPWRGAARNFATRLPIPNSWTGIVGEILAIGNVIGLGGVLTRMMLEISEGFTKEVPTVTAVYRLDKVSLKTRISIKLLTLLLSLIASLIWVYANYLNNSGLERLWSFLSVLPNNVAFAFVGYEPVISKGVELINYYRMTAEQREIENFRGILMGRIKYVMCNGIVIPNNIKTTEKLIEYFLNLKIKESRYSLIRKPFQAISAAIPLVYAITEGSLGREFVYNNLIQNNIFVILCVAIIVIPGFVISLISTFMMFGLLFSMIIGENNEASIQSLLYPYLSWFISLIMNLISLTMPGASAEVANQTILKETESEIIAWIGTIGMILFQILLVKFISSQSTTDIMVAVQASQAFDEKRENEEEGKGNNNNVVELTESGTALNKLEDGPASEKIEVSSEKRHSEKKQKEDKENLVESENKLSKPALAAQYQRLGHFFKVVKHAHPSCLQRYVKSPVFNP